MSLYLRGAVEHEATARHGAQGEGVALQLTIPHLKLLHTDAAPKPWLVLPCTLKEGGALGGGEGCDGVVLCVSLLVTLDLGVRGQCVNIIC